jgi:hypothetical protein
MSKIFNGEAKDIETIAKLRPWIEEEIKETYGYKGETKLITDYDKDRQIFKFQIVFSDEPRQTDKPVI